MTAPSSIIDLIREEINKNNRNNVFIATLIAVNPVTRFASIRYTNTGKVAHNISIDSSVSMANLSADDAVIVLRLPTGMPVIIGAISPEKAGSTTDKFVGGIKIGTQAQMYLPTTAVVGTYEITAYESSYSSYVYDSYDNLLEIEGTYSSSYVEIRQAVSEDHYSGEIIRYFNNLYAWASSYRTSYSDSYGEEYGLPAEWVRWDDARFIQGYAVTDDAPENNNVLVFDANMGMYKAQEVVSTHATSHEDAGSDEIIIENLPTNDSTAMNLLQSDGDGTLSWITPSSNPGAASAILKSDASGYLQLERLGVGVSPSYALHIDNSDAISVRLDADAGYIGLSPNFGEQNFHRYVDSTSSPTFIFRKGRGTRASTAIAQDGDYIGNLLFYGLKTAPSTFGAFGRIRVQADGTVDGSNVPGKMSFATNPAAGLVDRMVILPDGEVGVGNFTPVQRFEIASNDNTDRISIYHDNTDAYLTWDDGMLYLKSAESGNNGMVGIQGADSSKGGVLYIYDEDDAEQLSLTASSGSGTIQVSGSSPGLLKFQSNAYNDAAFFYEATSGDTKEVLIYGYRAGDAKRSLEIGVGIDADDTASFDGLSNYYFDGSIGVGISSPSGKLHIHEVGGASTVQLYSIKQNNQNKFYFETHSATSWHTNTISGRRSGGSYAVPSGVSADNYLLTIEALPYRTTAWGAQAASINFFAEENSTDSNYPAYISFSTRPPSHTTAIPERMRITSEGDVGIGVVPVQKLEIGSDDNSDRISIYHDNTDAYMKWDDGVLTLQTDEGTNTNTFVYAKGKGTGYGVIRAYDNDDAEYLNLQAIQGIGYVSIAGSSPVSLEIQYTGDSPVDMFAGSTEGTTQEFKIYGYRTSDAKRSLEIGVGVDAADTASFDGLSNYLFDGAIQVNTDLYVTSGIRIGDTSTAPDDNTIEIEERSSDPGDPSEGNGIIWLSDGTGQGDDGDLIWSRTYGGTTYHAVLNSVGSGAILADVGGDYDTSVQSTNNTVASPATSTVSVSITLSNPGYITANARLLLTNDNGGEYGYAAIYVDSTKISELMQKQGTSYDDRYPHGVHYVGAGTYTVAIKFYTSNASYAAKIDDVYMSVMAYEA